MLHICSKHVIREAIGLCCPERLERGAVAQEVLGRDAVCETLHYTALAVLSALHTLVENSQRYKLQDEGLSD